MKPTSLKRAILILSTYFQPGMLGVHFTWHDYMKPLSGAVIGVSPEYELALYTLCHVVKPDSV